MGRERAEKLPQRTILVIALARVLERSLRANIVTKQGGRRRPSSEDDEGEGQARAKTRTKYSKLQFLSAE